MSEENKTQEQTTEEFYIKLKDELNKVENFPVEFTYKFILPTDNQKIAELKKVFDDARAQFQNRESKNGKYTSITVVIYAMDADQVIHYYKKVGEIPGVIML
ncbi:DUF493 domain-containing protein [Ornithobacterium rhinotracheale]|uniref:DUF493 domain-containing protein n=1 Tax=Ornithobacterium rhinotracheale TaxID=28251 RepID=A0A410JR49_ORNRH|nr:DUF493 family protein [Ornithobacterium rhinotracheale]QAR30635.1 DUF493 domain-containing protein [Ornithobacterium rhinotracheale]